ncbi:MAG TPA: hypothetical protein VEC17_02540 [Candidatus Binatia bacterium]|nr:hypothetical protein [Candidatus Binatia bacterium]
MKKSKRWLNPKFYKKISKQINHLFHKGLEEILSVCKARLVNWLVGSIVTFILTVFPWSSSIQEEPRVINIGYEVEKQVIGEQTCFVICEDFSNLNNWERSEYFNIVSFHPTTLNAPVSDYLSGWVMDYPDLFAPNFVSTLTVVPLGLSPNIVFRWNEIEYILGDGSYKRISVKNKGLYVAPKGYVSKHFTLPSQIEKGSNVVLQIWTTPVKGSNRLILHSVITYFNNLGDEETISVPEFIVHLSGDPNNTYGKIGVGLIDPFKTKEITAQFIKFEVK